jgi:hypothetical protein
MYSLWLDKWRPAPNQTAQKGTNRRKNLEKSTQVISSPQPWDMDK